MDIWLLACGVKLRDGIRHLAWRADQHVLPQPSERHEGIFVVDRQGRAEFTPGSPRRLKRQSIVLVEAIPLFPGPARDKDRDARKQRRKLVLRADGDGRELTAPLKLKQVQLRLLDHRFARPAACPSAFRRHRLPGVGFQFGDRPHVYRDLQALEAFVEDCPNPVHRRRGQLCRDVTVRCAEKQPVASAVGLYRSDQRPEVLRRQLGAKGLTADPPGRVRLFGVSGAKESRCADRIP